MRDYRVFLEGHELDGDGQAVTKMELVIKATDEMHAKTIVRRSHSYWRLVHIVEVF